MKLFIPTVGTELILTQPWEFTLYEESRNMGFAKTMNITAWSGRWNMHRKEPDEELPPNVYVTHSYDDGTAFFIYTEKVTLPIGTKLIVDRIYLRKGISDFDSLTFRIKKTKKGVAHGRFWAKLADVNNIEFTLPPLLGSDEPDDSGGFYQ